jgi:homocysteine S-methyltransferase
MGTLLHSKGIAPSRCLEELNLSLPSLIQQIHREYREAGAGILQTNTFGANAARLAQQGLEDKCQVINQIAVNLARAAAGQHGLVAGAVGPLGVRTERANVPPPNADTIFREQIEALADAGADLILLETFRDLSELREAIAAARAACDLPLVVSVSPDEKGNLAAGEGPELFVPQLAEWGADVIGCNCGVGPEAMLNTVQRMAAHTTKPLVAQPSAGLPTVVGGQLVYPYPPESFARLALSLVQSGVRWIGGCCGTTPEHIRAVRGALEAIRPNVSARLAFNSQPAFSPGQTR